MSAFQNSTRRKIFLFLSGFGLLLGYNIIDAVTDASPIVQQFSCAKVSLREVPHSSYRELLEDELVFIDSLGTAWTAPHRTLSDGAAVPRLALWLTDQRFAPHVLKAAIIHDAYCGGGNEDRAPLQHKKRPWREVHRMFHEALLAGGTPPCQAKIMFAAVWLGGPRWNDADHELDDVANEVLYAEFLACKQWIEEESPDLPTIEAWMDKRERHLRLRPA